VIQLAISPTTNVHYANLANFIVGPFSPDSLVDDLISYRSMHDELIQGTQMYHENNVDNRQFEADLTFSPITIDLRLIPTASFPNRVEWSCKYSADNRSLKITSNGGLVSDVGYWYDPSAFWHNVVKKEGNTVFVYRIQANSNGTIRNVEKVLYQNCRVVNNALLTTYTFWTVYSPSTALYKGNWKGLVDVSTVIDTANTIIGSRTPTIGPTANYSVPLYKSFTQPTLSIEDSRRELEDLCRIIKETNGLNPEEKHFGDLAQLAVEKIDANNVNMFAFLRDLRRPLDLIPKLKNLSKLKTHAGNYLAFEYGVLPTIDDLSAIFQAFQQALPYRDRFGFNLYTALHEASVSDGLLSASLEQRIKLAIRTEDTQFIELLDKMSNTGFDLTFQNVWDLIPYSFVLDWFVDVGGFLERVDTSLRILRMDIRYVTMSHKRVVRSQITPTLSFPFSGTINMVEYSRWTVDRCPLPPLFAPSKPTVTSHWLEAGALLVQRR
jgi:hypothetical protein